MTENRAKDILAVLDEKILDQGVDDYPRTVEMSLNLVGGIRDLIHSYVALIQKVADLKAEIESMQQACAEQGMKLIDVTEAESSLKFVID